MGQKHDRNNYVNKKLKGEPYSAYHETLVTSEVNSANISISKGETLFIERTMLETETLFTNKFIVEGEGYPTSEMVGLKSKIRHQNK